MSAPVLIMMASGYSSRFGRANKLLSTFRGKPLCASSAPLGGDLPRTHRLAIVPKESAAIARIYESAGWSIIPNGAPNRGLSYSLKLGIRSAQDLKVECAGICLADMPLITSSHMDRLFEASRTHDAVMSVCKDTLMPPAAFRATLFEALLALEGDRGAKNVFLASENRTLIELPERVSVDVDTQSDLSNLIARESTYV